MASGAVTICVDWSVLVVKGRVEVEPAFFLRSTRLRAGVIRDKLYSSERR